MSTPSAAVLQAEARQLLAKADTTGDPILRDGYRSRARDLERRAAAAPAPRMAPAVRPGTLNKISTPDIIKAAVAQAVRSAQERNRQLATQVDSLRRQMNAMPQAGGPALMRTRPAVADGAADRAKIDTLLAKADAATDPTLKAGYRQRAKVLQAQARSTPTTHSASVSHPAEYDFWRWGV